MALSIVDAADAHRYEARSDGELVGVIEYGMKPGKIALIHTEVAPDHEGHGIAGKLARFALEDARRRSLRVIPACPYVRAFLERHPEFADVVTRYVPKTEPGRPTTETSPEDRG